MNEEFKLLWKKKWGRVVGGGRGVSGGGGSG